MILDVFKLVYEFFVNGKIKAGLAAIIAVGIGYLLFAFLEVETAVITLVGLAIIALLCNLPQIFEKGNIRIHSMSNKYRRVVSKIIRHDLKKALAKLGGHRIFVTEGHNGTSSLGDLAFLYMDITYLESAIEDDWLNFQYRNFSTTLHPGFDGLAKHSTFVGSTDKLKTVDSRLARIIESNGTKYLIATCLYNAHNECIGTVILTFPEEPVCPMEKMADFQKVANKIERLIDKQGTLKEVEKMAEDL